MNRFSGIFNRNGVPVEDSFISSLSRRTTADAQVSVKTFFAEAVAFAATGGERAAQHFYEDKEANVSILGDIRLYNREELGRCLGRPFAANRTISDYQLVVEGYKKWGDDCVRRLMGDFAFAIWNGKEKRLLAARDPLGQKPLFYYAGPDRFLFSNRIQVLSGYSFAAERDQLWIADYLQGINSYKDRTPFKKILRLLPGHQMVVCKDTIHYSAYWNIEGATPPLVKSRDEAVEGFRALLEEAVRLRNCPSGKLGVELSGGLDSASIAVLARRMQKAGQGEVVAFSNVLPPAYKNYYQNFSDEWDKAANVCRYSGIQRHYSVDRLPFEPEKMLQNTLDIIGYPTNFFFTVFQSGLYAKAQQEGVKTVLSGFGGDELLSQNAFPRYQYTLMQEGRIFRLIHMHRQYSGKSWSGAAFKGSLQYAKFLLRKEKKAFDAILERKWAGVILRDELCADLQLKDLFFQKGHFPPGQSLRERSLYGLNNGCLTERIESGNLVTSAYGLQYNYPLFHIPLIEYYFHLPDEWKVGDGSNRWFFRQAVKDILPPDILHQQKSTETGTIPFYGVESSTHFNQLKDLCLSRNNGHEIFEYIDRKKVERLTAGIEDTEMLWFDNLQSVAMMSMFLEKTRNCFFYENA
ncbi:asparagine synthase-related protein [Paraflavisolibacter sp. H34]|uniref:asparagine synthetase B family protein n=1 Tax=Huijunlia imazamoxiresistens TaxID=3127457 RepID=UPI00301639B2